MAKHKTHEKIGIERCTEFCVKAFGETLAHGKFVASRFDMNSRDQLATSALRAGLTEYINGDKRIGRRWKNMKVMPTEREGEILLNAYHEYQAEFNAKQVARSKKAAALGRKIRAKVAKPNEVASLAENLKAIEKRLAAIEDISNKLYNLWHTGGKTQ